jgi:hypothetical protein
MGAGGGATEVGATCSCVELVVAVGDVIGANSVCLRNEIFEDDE